MRAEELLQYITTERTEQEPVNYRGVFVRGNDVLVLSDWTNSERLALANARVTLTRGLLDGTLDYLYNYDAFQQMNKLEEEPVVAPITYRPKTDYETGKLQQLQDLVSAINENSERGSEDPGKGLQSETNTQDLSELFDAIETNKTIVLPEETEPAIVDAPKKRKRWIIPLLLGICAAASTPLWAVSYPIAYCIPDSAAISSEASHAARFYERKGLPECTMEGMEFIGWFEDPELIEPVNIIQYTLGEKVYYAGFKPMETPVEKNIIPPDPVPEQTAPPPKAEEKPASDSGSRTEEELSPEPKIAVVETSSDRPSGSEE